MRQRGFSVAELLVVIAIVMVLAALIKPIVTQARVAAAKSVCTSNLRQQYLALAMYRDACDGTDSPAPPTSMGLPPFFSPNFLSAVAGPQAGKAAELQCKSPRSYIGEHATVVSLWPDTTPGVGVTVASIEAAQREWIEYVAKLGLRTVVIADPNHQSHWPVTSFSTQQALGLALDGSIVNRKGRGMCLTLQWWEKHL